ncbi:MULTISPECIES: hypothetical protein [Tessaracoccus]|uniref:hypothetical protein n=1 Tax=Tessaracoccus TaxID=72763 RepID=UPI00099C9875|nr:MULTISPECIES: hypothetical protein [Tessaracoccus]AQX16168.1 hypothetical protein BKM78_09795 [Tessaracoccus sp. T2.5-30]VEP40743.1 hypothetical protein TLA_TLA_01977 [Tessaracoccus lapidicaptus]
MPLDGATGADLDGRIAEWRAWLTRRGAAAPDVNALEERLRSHAEDLALAGLSADEAFLIAATRLASEDALTRDWARGQQNSLVSRLLVAGDDSIRTTRRAMVVGVAIATVGAFFAVAAVVANIYPFPGATETSATEILLVVHLPVLLWFVVGLAHAGTRWRQSDARMDAVRFTGEWAIYFALIALGGGVLVGLSVAVFSAIRLEVEDVVVEWVLPFGAAGAVIVAALLVEAKRSVIENIAPVLTKLFTPLFALLLLAFLGAMAWTRTVDIDREVLIIFDLLLVVVLALALFSMSARGPGAPPGAFDRLQLVLVVSALVVDAVGLSAMVSRIALWGPSPNKLVALGLNIVLFINLAWLAWMLLGFLRRRRTHALLERWQMAYLPIYAAWAAIVVVVVPPVFGFA